MASSNLDNKQSRAGRMAIHFNSRNSSCFYNDVVSPLNDYLKKCRFVTQTVIQNFVENKIDQKEEEISGLLALPVFIGFLGTLAGILEFFYSKFEVKAANQTLQANELMQLMPGIATAMWSTLLGLFITVCLYLFFNKVKSDVEKAKDKFMSYVATMDLSDNSELATLFGTMVESMSLFNGEFAKNINGFSSALGDIKSIGENQQKLVDSLNKVGLNGIVENNITMMNSFSLLACLVSNVLNDFSNIAGSVDRIDELNKSLDLHIEKTKAYTESMLDSMEKIFKEGVKKQLEDSVKENLDSMYVSVKSSLEQVANNELYMFKEVIFKMAEELKEGASANKVWINETLNMIQLVKDMAQNQITESVQNMVEKIQEMTDSIQQIDFAGRLDDISVKLGKLPEDVVQQFDDKYRNIQTCLDRISMELASNIGKLYGIVLEQKLAAEQAKKSSDEQLGTIKAEAVRQSDISMKSEAKLAAISVKLDELTKQLTSISAEMCSLSKEVNTKLSRNNKEQLLSENKVLNEGR